MQQKILIADDDTAIIESLQLLLEDEGYQVASTTNGESVAGLTKNLPDLILLDIWMSGVDGSEVCRRLKAQASTRHIPVILVSANRDTSLIAAEAGANGFIAKPYDIDDMLAVIKKHLKPVGDRPADSHQTRT